VPDDASAYFVRTGPTTFRPTQHTSGAWSTTEQHIAPLTGLVVHEIERVVAARARTAPGRATDDKVIARLTYDILGVVSIEDLDIAVEVVRPGRTIELLEAAVTQHGRTVCRVRAWRLGRQDTSAVAGGAPEPVPHPDTVEPQHLGAVWPGGYIGGLDVRPLTPPRPGRTTTWVATGIPLLPDEPVSDLARFVGLVDTANGIAVREDPRAWLFPNVDLTIHLHRTPRDRWVGLDTTVVFGADGVGLTETVLHDVHGPVGRAAQSLTIRPVTGPA
jgi:hypothetical protein